MRKNSVERPLSRNITLSEEENKGLSKSLREYRIETGDEGKTVSDMFRERLCGGGDDSFELLRFNDESVQSRFNRMPEAQKLKMARAAIRYMRSYFESYETRFDAQFLHEVACKLDSDIERLRLKENE